MKKICLTVWAAICTVWASTAGTWPALASEQTDRAADKAEQVLLTMDVFQTVCLIIVISAVVLFVAFYIAKAVLKKMHVAPEEQDEENQTKEK